MAVLNIAQQLQNKLDAIDTGKDRDTPVWAHGFHTGVLNGIQTRLPDLIDSKTLRQSSRARLDELLQRIGELNSGVRAKDDLDSLDAFQRDLDEPGAAPAPARPKPRPKGLSGGAAVPLPETGPPV
jgi:hypothetical protein